MRCEDKRHYLTCEAAERAATRTRQAARGQKLYPYQCDRCGLWHLTSWTPSQQETWIAARGSAHTPKQSVIHEVEPPSLKGLRTRLVQISAALKLDEKRQDAKRRQWAERVGKLIEADLALDRAIEEYKAAQDEVLRLLGI